MLGLVNKGEKKERDMGIHVEKGKWKRERERGS